jgi:hypothetical protein
MPRPPNRRPAMSGRQSRDASTIRSLHDQETT